MIYSYIFSSINSEMDRFINIESDSDKTRIKESSLFSMKSRLSIFIFNPFGYYYFLGFQRFFEHFLSQFSYSLKWNMHKHNSLLVFHYYLKYPLHI